MGDIRPVDAILNEVIVESDRIGEVRYEQFVVASVSVYFANVISVGEDQLCLDSCNREYYYFAKSIIIWNLLVDERKR